MRIASTIGRLLTFYLTCLIQAKDETQDSQVLAVFHVLFGVWAFIASIIQGFAQSGLSWQKVPFIFCGCIDLVLLFLFCFFHTQYWYMVFGVLCLFTNIIDGFQTKFPGFTRVKYSCCLITHTSLMVINAFVLGMGLPWMTWNLVSNHTILPPIPFNDIVPLFLSLSMGYVCWTCGAIVIIWAIGDLLQTRKNQLNQQTNQFPLLSDVYHVNRRPRDHNLSRFLWFTMGMSIFFLVCNISELVWIYTPVPFGPFNLTTPEIGEAAQATATILMLFQCAGFFGCIAYLIHSC